jgi:hypothetical protein
MPLTVLDAKVTTNSITIFFSEPVDTTSGTNGATNLANYTVFDPDSTVFSKVTKLSDVTPAPTPTAPDAKSVLIKFAADQFNEGDSVLVIITNIASAARPGTPGLPGNLGTIARDVPFKGGTGKIVRDVENAIAYPILTEEIGYRPSPVGAGTTMPPVPTGAGASLGQIAAKAVSDALGWKVNAADPKGFVGSLTQSFTLTEVEGHVESKWTPRTYAVQTDLSGGISGAQASLYTRAKDALDKSLPLLDGLYPLDPEADPEDVKALREMARSQMNQIVKELGSVGGPSVLRVNTYFQILLGGDPIVFSPPSSIQPDPDKIQGTLGSLRETYGIQFEGNQFSNSVADEEDITNFRIISDYMTSLLQSWIANGRFFVLSGGGEAFFGTQLVLISRQLSVIIETVNEVRFALDSVFIGPSERQTLLLTFADPALPPMFMEAVLQEVESLAAQELPALLRDGGRLAVKNNILPVVETLQNLVEAAHDPTNINTLPDGFKTVRVKNALDDLSDQLETLFELAEQVARDLPGVEPSAASLQQAVSSLQKPGLVAVPSAIDFGTVLTNETSPAVTVTLLNLSTQLAFTQVTLGIAGPNTGDFAFNPLTFAGGIGPLKSSAVTITFTPKSPGKVESATLTISANYQDAQGNLQTQTATVSLMGTAGI